MIPGEYILKCDDIICNAGRKITHITVVNTGDRPVQVGSHFHFFEVNRLMEFNREKAFGQRLNIASGTATRFEPGEQKEIELIPVAGNTIIHGFNSLSDGNITEANKRSAVGKLVNSNFKNRSHEPEH